MATQPLSLSSQIVAYNDAADLRNKTPSDIYQGATIAEVLALGGGSGPKVYRASIPAIPQFGTAGPAFIYENTVGALSFQFEDYGIPGSFSTGDLSSILGTDVQKVMVRANDDALSSGGAATGISAVYAQVGPNYFIAINGAAKDPEGLGIENISFNLEILLYP